MLNTQDKDLINWIVKRSIQGASQDDMIIAVIERTDLSWKQAEELVQQIQQENETRIIRGQSPLLTLIALTTYVGGLGIIGYEIYYLASVLALVQKTGVGLLDIPNLLSLSSEYISFFFELTPLGLAMILGSLIGMRDVWKALLFPDKD